MVNQYKKNPLNLNSIFNSLFGFLLALTIHNMIELVFNDFIFIYIFFKVNNLIK